MKQAVYADVLFLINMMVCGFILLACCRLLHRRVGKLRLLLGSAVGGAYSLVIFLPRLPMPFLMQLICIAVSVLITFGFKGKKSFLRAYSCVLLVNFIFAGMMLATEIILEPSGMLYQSGAVYFDVSFTFIAVMVSVCYIAVFVYEKLAAKRLPANRTGDAVITYRGKTVSAPALLDSGNLLTDSFTGKPVTVISQPLAEKLLGCETSGVSPGLRLIPCRTVGSDGLMTVFTAKEMIVTVGGKKSVFNECVIGISKTEIASGDCGVLLNSAMFNENGKGVQIVVG